MSRRPLVPKAKKELEKMKDEFANEMGIKFNDKYNGNKTSRLNGHIGGLMTKKMVESFENSLIDK